MHGDRVERDGRVLRLDSKGKAEVIQWVQAVWNGRHGGTETNLSDWREWGPDSNRRPMADGQWKKRRI